MPRLLANIFLQYQESNYHFISYSLMWCFERTFWPIFQVNIVSDLGNCRKYMSDEFESIFTEKRDLMSDAYNQEFTLEEEIVTTDDMVRQLRIDM